MAKIEIASENRQTLTGLMQRAGGGTAYLSMEELMTYGIGFAVLLGDDVIGQALSWINSKQGIEVQIGTDEAHQRKGLATITGASLIAYCLERDIQPHWNAANAESAGLTEKLGYVQNDFYHPIPLFS